MKNKKPNKVSTALRLLWAAMVISIIRGIMDFSNTRNLASDQGFGLGFIIFVTFFSLAVIAFLIFMIGKRKNWARITFLALLILGMPLGVFPLFKLLLTNPIFGVLGIGQVIMQIIAMILLFQKPSSNWFKSR